MRSWKSIFVVVAVCALAAPSYGVVIGDFETGLDLWEPGDASVTLASDATWASQGTQSLKVVVADGSNPWNTVMIANQGSILPLVLSNDTFSVDVRTLTGDLGGDMGLHLIIGGADSLGNQIWDDYGYRWVGNGAFDNPTTASWTYDPARLQNLANNGLAWWQLMIITNNDWVVPGGTFYLDNAALTPEPASLTMLALAGLLLRRRR